MGVTKVWERWEGRGGSTDEQGVRTLKRQWGVETDSDTDGEPEVVDAVIASDASAKLFASHPKWTPALCRKLTPRPWTGPKQWLVDAEYSSRPFAAGGGDAAAGGTLSGSSSSASPSQLSQDTPANQRPPVITVGRKDFTEPLEFDVVTGDRVVNTVGDPFDPVPEIPRGDELITFKFFRSPGQLAWAIRSAFRDTINSLPVVILGKTYPAFTLRCVDYSLESVWETDGNKLALFFALTVQLEEKRAGWRVKLLNTGRREKRLILGLPAAVALVDGNGQPVADPVPLDSAGAPVAPGGTYHYRTFDGYTPAAWDNLLA